MAEVPARIVKITAPCGWEQQFNDFVHDFCVDNGLVFVDRANVLEPRPFTKKNATWYSWSHDTEPPLPSYVWFAHRGFPELPFTEVLPIPLELL